MGLLQGNWQSSWLKNGELDSSALALARAWLGLWLLCESLTRLVHVTTLYGEHGLLPRSLATRLLPAFEPSLHLASGAIGLIAAAIIVQALLAVALMIGFRASRAASWLLLLLVSLNFRNPWILNQGDALLVLVLAWMALVPLANRWSVDAALSSQPGPARIAPLAGAGLILLLGGITFGAGLASLFSSAWIHGTALASWLDDAVWSRWPARLLLAAGMPGSILSIILSLLLLTGGGALIASLLLPRLRAAGLLLIALGALLEALLLDAGAMPWSLLLACVMLSPPALWDRLQAHARKRRVAGKLSIYYDSDCAFCLRMVRIICTGLLLDHAEIRPAESSNRARTLVEANRSWVVIDVDQRAHLKWSAFAVLVARSPLLSWASGMLMSAPLVRLGDAWYDHVVRQRPTYARLLGFLQHPDPTPGRGGRPSLVLLLAAACAIGTIGNLLGGSGLLRLAAPQEGFDVHWRGGLPLQPPAHSGWLLMPTQLGNGTRVDLFPARAGDPPAMMPPPESKRVPSSFRLRSFEYSALDWQDAVLLNSLAQWSCRRWNASHGDRTADRALDMEIIWMQTNAGQAAEQQSRGRYRCD